VLLGLLGVAADTVGAADEALTPAERKELDQRAKEVNQQAVARNREGKHEEATKLAEEVVVIRRRLYPTNEYPDGHPDLAEALNYLGYVLKEQRDYARAEPYFRDALAMYQKLYTRDRYPDGHPKLPVTLNFLGRLLQEQADYARAEPFLKDALAMRQKLYPTARYPDGHSDLALSLSNMGALLHMQGEYTRAEPFYKDALAMYQKLYPRDRYPDGQWELATTFHNLGALLEAQGEYARAEPFYKDALAMRRKLYPKARYPDGHPLLAASFNNLGGLLKQQGEYARAEPFYKDALAMYQQLYPRDRYHDGHPHLAVSLNNLGGLHWLQEDYRRAEALGREALEMRRKLYPRDRYPDGHPELATSLNNLGSLLEAQGEYAGAEPFYKDALAMYQKLYPRDRYRDGHPHLASSLNSLGMLLQDMGEYAKAEPFYRDALAMRQKLYPRDRYRDGHPQLAESLHNLGVLLEAQGEYARAEPYLRDALAIYAAQLRNFADLKSEAEALNRLAQFPGTLNGALVVSRHLPPRAEHYQPLWQRKSALTRIFERRHLDALATQDDDTRRLALDLRGARDRLARLTVVPLPDPTAHAQRLQALTEEKERAEQKLASRLNVQASTRKESAASAEDLLRALPRNAAFVDLLRYDSVDRDPEVRGKKGEAWTYCYVAFVLRNGEPVRRVELGATKPIEEALRLWRREIIDWRPDRPATTSGADTRLSELLWKPLSQHIPADTATVYLSPDAALTALPWAALPGRDKGKVLLEEHALALVPHGPWLLQHLLSKPDKEEGPGALLALGAVAYGRAPKESAGPPTEDVSAAATKRGGRRAEWDDLKATERELEQVIARAGQREVLVRRGTDAGIAQVARDLEQARYAHLATHGFFDDQGTRSVLQLTEDDYRRGWRGERVGAGLRSPLLLSGLVLAGANRKDRDRPETWAADGGILLGEDIVGRNLHRMELAVLSACETGLGDVAGGEGVFGLQRAFHVAGCKNVVASLWQVDDEATAALMNLFYARLWHADPAKRLPPLAALREAQLTLYRQPELVAQFARGEVRGPKSDKVVKIADYAPPKPDEVLPGGKAHPKQWAAFVLSGDGR
jgi:CHAT domain-containing protein/Tfp pilus assembly protein PilF